jgi:hypothetical protein
VKADEVRAAVDRGAWALSRHARERAGRRKITALALVQALARGEILEDYPSDPRGPSALVLGHDQGGMPLHAVVAFDPTGTLIVITVYEPEPPKWVDERTRGT